MCVCCHRNSSQLQGENEIVGRFKCGSAICEECLTVRHYLLRNLLKENMYKEHIFLDKHRFICPVCQAPEQDITYVCERCNDHKMHIAKYRDRHCKKKHAPKCKNCHEPIIDPVTDGEDEESNQIIYCNKCYFKCPICQEIFSTKDGILNYQCADDPKNKNANPHYMCAGCAERHSQSCRNRQVEDSKVEDRCPVCRAERK